MASVRQSRLASSLTHGLGTQAASLLRMDRERGGAPVAVHPAVGMDGAATLAAEVTGSLAGLRHASLPLPSLLHDARNMITAISLFSEMLGAPGVLGEGYRHYASELKQVAHTSERLLDRIATLSKQPTERPAAPIAVPAQWTLPENASATSHPVLDLRNSVLSLRALLATLVGPSIQLGMSIDCVDAPVTIGEDDLARILVNLVKNAAEALPGGGHVCIALTNGHQATAGEAEKVLLTVSDDGAGIPVEMLELIFEPGYSTKLGQGLIPGRHRGLGLAIVRSLVESIGGSVHASSTGASPIQARGTCLSVILPVHR